MPEELWTYFDPKEKNPNPVHVEYTDDEIRRICQMAEWYARVCKLIDRPVPPDPQRAVLAAAEFLHEQIMIMNAAAERAAFDAEGRQLT